MAIDNRTLAVLKQLAGNTGGGTGGANIDVVAEVGQTIIVKEVDANGKPTAWEAADFQERTHWTEEAVLYGETEITFSDNQYFGTTSFAMEMGKTYTVIWNGVRYNCIAQDAASIGYSGFAAVGNIAGALGTGDTGEPFVLGAGLNQIMVTALDGSTSATVSILGEVVTKLPQKYIDFGNAFPFTIEVTGSGTTDDPYKTDVSVVELSEAYNSGRIIQMKLFTETIIEILMPYSFTCREGIVGAVLFCNRYTDGLVMSVNNSLGYDISSVN